jgi:hypothetical protein
MLDPAAFRGPRTLGEGDERQEQAARASREAPGPVHRAILSTDRHDRGWPHETRERDGPRVITKG